MKRPRGGCAGLRDRFRGSKDYVYFIQAGTDGPIKIGRSENPNKRLGELATGCWLDLRLILVLRDGGLESWLHLRFGRHFIAREWFRSSEEILRFCAHCLHFCSVPASALPKAARAIPGSAIGINQQAHTSLTKQIFATIARGPEEGLTPKEIALALGRTGRLADSTRRLTLRLLSIGKIKRTASGRYVLCAAIEPAEAASAA